MDKIRHLLIRLLCLDDVLPSDSAMQKALELEDLARTIRRLGPENRKSDNVSDLLDQIKILLQPLTMDEYIIVRQDSDAELTIEGAASSQPDAGNRGLQSDEHCGHEPRFPEKAVEPSELALEIIRLRDWVLVSKDSGTEETQKVLEAIYVMLGQALTMEEITEYGTSEGVFDSTRQQAVMSTPAPEPAKKNFIHTSIRPGYLFMGKILRQQQVSIFV